MKKEKKADDAEFKQAWDNMIKRALKGQDTIIIHKPFEKEASGLAMYKALKADHDNEKKAAEKQAIPTKPIQTLLQGGGLDFSIPSNLSLLFLTGGLAGAGGAAAGYGAAKATSPSIGSIENLKKKEQVAELDRGIGEVESRAALLKQRQNI